MVNQEIPLTRGEAEKQGYYRGSCFDGMGMHYFKDLKVPGGMSWDSDGLQPVVAMYNSDESLNAVFFASSDNQNSIWGSHEWEPVPLNDWAMCKNWCPSAGCNWDANGGHEGGLWSTQHWYFGNHEEVKCKDFENKSWGAGQMKCGLGPGVSCCLE